ncbi:ankyrin repeat domain-containing protein [Aspergillus affinis]|uniref:ankyrin repeat domain-containing protein n=1 Tax=Aspergillus affinis TaxID=1070780 RepID=UPI0022FF2DA3|nr:ankyrin [Aspergillus affinis]KAI9039970.1 ankyrin [Aspergillus affinis]
MAGESEEKKSLSLLGLPNEILYHVANFLEYADDASAFSRSCRFLYSLVNPTLMARYTKIHEDKAILYTMDKGDHTLMQQLIEAGASPSGYEKRWGGELARRATEDGHTKLLRVLLGFDPDSDGDGDSDGDADADADGDGDSDDKPDWNLYDFLVKCALLYYHWETARFLISCGADPSLNGNHEWLWAPALNIMADKGSLDSVRFLVEEVEVSLDSYFGNRTSLMNAASRGSLDIVEYLIAKGAEHTQRDHCDRTAMLYAACENHEDIMLFLMKMEKEADIFGGERDLKCLAYIACQKNARLVKLLLDMIDIKAKIASGFALDSLFYASAVAGCESAVQLLLDAGCDPLGIQQSNASLERDEFSDPLQQAAINGHAGIFRRILDFIGARNPSELENSLANVIRTASRANQVRLLREILDSKIARQLTSAALLDALYNALEVATPYIEVIRLLLQRGATVKNKRSDRLLLSTAAREGSPEVMRLLLEITSFDPTPDVREHSGYLESLFDGVLKSRDASIERIRPLLESSKSFHPANMDSLLALGNATTAGNVEVVKYFLDHGFDPNAPVPQFPFPEARKRLLGLAATYVSNEMTNLLLAYGADVDADADAYADASGRCTHATALLCAVRRDNRDAAKTLLNHGANPFAKCNDVLETSQGYKVGETPVHEAIYWPKAKCLPILLKAVEERGLQWDIRGAVRSMQHKVENPNYDVYDELPYWSSKPLLKNLVQHYC